MAGRRINAGNSLPQNMSFAALWGWSLLDWIYSRTPQIQKILLEHVLLLDPLTATDERKRFTTLCKQRAESLDVPHLVT
jgi:hypothetical protein